MIPGKDVRCDYLRWYRMASAVTTIRLELARCQQMLNFQSAKEACMSMLLCVCVDTHCHCECGLYILLLFWRLVSTGFG